MRLLKFITKIIFLASFLLITTACNMFGRVKEITPDEFKDALCEIYGIEEADINSFAIDGGEHAEGWSFRSSECYIRLTKNLDCSVCNASEDAHDRFESSYNRFENLEDTYSVDDVRRRISNDMGYLIFTTSDMEMINEYSSSINSCPDDCDSLLIAYYYSGTTVISIDLFYDSNDSENELAPYYEFVEILDLPSL